MALKALFLRRKIDDRTKTLDALREKDADFEKREAEYAAAIDEVTDKTPAEDRSALEAEITAFDAELQEHRNSVNALESEISELQEQLAAEEARQDTTPKHNDPAKAGERKDESTMNTITRARFFGKMSAQERDAFAAREDVQAYLQEIRTSIKEKRAITNVGLTIPEVMLGLLRENLINYSTLYRHVTVRTVRGDGRYLIMGVVPEGIWTECCANLNELTLSFNDLEFNCYMVAGYFAVCNANIEDSDLDLIAELLEALAQAIGLALDKAILYGRNAAGAQNMPQGIVSRLAQTAQPAGYPATARPWADLHTSNIKTIAASATGVDFFKALALASGAAKGRYARGEKVWVMNEVTYTKVVAEAMSIDAGGAIVSGVNGTMPVIGGIIEVLNFIPDNVIIGGYFELYVLAERRGPRFGTSEHVRFLQDQTVMKGVARYDGAPAIAEAFIAVGLGDSAPTANAVAFDPDAANTVAGIVLPATASVAVGGKLQLPATLMPFGVSAAETWASATTAKATVDANGVVTGVASGTSVITVSAGGQSASCTVTVTT